MTHLRQARIVALILIASLLMAVAAQVAAWGDRWPGRNRPLPPAAAPVVLGTPLAPAELGPGWRFVVEIAFGAALSNPSISWSWTDVTSDVLQEGGRYINISPIGRQDENPQTPAANCALTLDNRLNRYSKANPLSPNWPNVRANTPVRVRITSDNGANWWVFFWGEATTWQGSWDETGNFAIVELAAKGRMQRLNQHTAPLRSAMERGITLDTANVPIAYWPLEEGANATVAASPIPGVASLTQTVAVGGFVYSTPSFASISVVPGSAPIPDFSNGGDMFAPVSGGTAGVNGWTVDTVLYFGSKMNTADGSVFMIGISTGWSGPLMQNQGEGFTLGVDENTGSPNNPFWSVQYEGYSGGTWSQSTAVQVPFSTITPFDGKPHMVRINAKQSSGNISVNLIIDGTHIFNGTVLSRTLKSVTGIEVGNSGFTTSSPLGIGHVGVWNGSSVPNHTGLMNGNTGETPVARMIRLCSEEGIEFQQVGFYASTVTMGAQGVDNFINLMRECADAEDGFLYDGVSAGLTYQPPSQRYDQATAITLDCAAHDTQIFQPLDDDLTRVNRATIDQKNGSTYVAEQTAGFLGTGPNGIGDNDAQFTINVDQARFAYYRSTWEVWKGAGNGQGFRFPIIPLNVRAHSQVAAKWIARQDGFPGPVQPGCRLDLINVNAWASQFPAGTVPLTIEGYSVRLTNLMFEIDLNCVTNRRYDVIKVADSQLGRVQTPGASLAGDTPVGGTTMSVATQKGSVGWTTTGPFPLFVEVDGIQVTVNSIGAATTDSQGRLVQTFTVDGTTVTKPLLTGVYIKIWHGGVVKY